jgi:radical SAM-linked protein
MDISSSDKQGEKEEGRICILVRFKVIGDMRFLSHAETMRVFQRACARAGVRMAYSRGFNPHPRLSLVLPRSVGVESDDELLCLWFEDGEEEIDSELLKRRLSGQILEGIKIFSVDVNRSKKVPEPAAARYLIKISDRCLAEWVKAAIEELSARVEIPVKRQINESQRVKVVDVRPFIKSVKLQGDDILVDCVISQSGTIRVDEILKLLHLRIEDIASPVRRIKVEYTD